MLALATEDRLQRRMDRGGAGGTGIFQANRRREAQCLDVVGQQGRGKVLIHKAGIEMANVDGVDLLRRDVGMRQSANGGLGHHQLGIEVVELTEWGVIPACDNGRSHKGFLA